MAMATLAKTERKSGASVRARERLLALERYQQNRVENF